MNTIGYYFDIDNQDVENWINQLTPQQKILLASALLQVGLDEQYEGIRQEINRDLAIDMYDRIQAARKANPDFDVQALLDEFDYDLFTEERY